MKPAYCKRSRLVLFTDYRFKTETKSGIVIIESTVHRNTASDDSMPSRPFSMPRMVQTTAEGQAESTTIVPRMTGFRDKEMHDKPHDERRNDKAHEA